MGWLAAALVLPLGDAGCLNPRPEDDPSVTSNIVPGDEAAAPPGESCTNNPALPACSVPIQGADGSEVPTVDAVDDVAPGPQAAAPPAPDAGVMAAGTTSDAGVDSDPADAQAP